MPRKGVKYPFVWTLVDENIENVERLRLDTKTQRELGCLVGERVFLEYPWAYVHRDLVLEFAKLPDSPLSAYREKIEAYEADAFLLGYSSTRLTSDEFVICLSEEAERLVSQRNRNITGLIWRKVIGKVIKTAKPWNSFNSGSEVDETFVRNTRELFEIEIVLPGKMLGFSRILGDRGSNDSRDSYVQLVNVDETFENIERRCISRAVQTNLQPRETFVQTYPGYPKNAWTQYTYEDKEEDEEEEEPRERTPLELFLQDRSQEMIDVIKYNAVVNLHVDDIENLSGRERDIEMVPEVAAFHQQVSFADFSLTANKALSDVSVHPKLTEYVAISYITDSIRAWKNEFQARVLLWKLTDPLRPQFVLEDHREIYSVSFCPYAENLVLGGCSTGQVIIWNMKDYRDDKNIKVGTTTRNNLPVFRPVVVSDKQRSHRLPVRKIQWMDAKYRIEPNGKMTKSSISSDVQFLTASADEGLIECRWEGESLEEKWSDVVECEVLNRSCVHNGPVAEITRSPHLRDVLLTIGGQVFAIWKDDYMDSPLFSRRTASWYATCCWANEPGVFLLGSQDGSLEIWDVKNEPNQPVFSKIVSAKSIVHLTLLEYPLFPLERSKMIGVGDQGGLFRVFKEPEIFRSEDAIERMDWFEEYVWREVRRKNVFISWQNDFLANDPTSLTNRSARRNKERKRETEEARERLRREQEARLRLKEEKRARSAPVPKHVAWKAKEFDRMKNVLLNKKHFDPDQLEAKRLPLVVLKAEREATLKRAQDKIARREEYFLNAVSLEFANVLEEKVEVLEFGEWIELGKSVDDYIKIFTQVQRTADDVSKE
ncbi:WD repeat-containing protein 63 [Habropoda laboriosa]|uniref:WD repeat-containing protein 63 n=1 Tax=Habropoda laboriosa TaxID=597456 RepID=A0A0L7R6R6_9HYME|nr:WD repeat-containing protein 63 [Habropoda laboriosa]